MAGVELLVDGMTDGLGAVHQIEYGTIEDGSETFLFTERPFGNGTLPSNTQLLSGGGALRHVATKLRRDNGLGGFHDTSYAYQNVGVESTKHWGFIGFYAQRITDEQSGIVSYAQYRVDFPYFGQLARYHQFDALYGSHTQTLNKSEFDYAQQTISHGSNNTNQTYVESHIEFAFEGTTQLGAWSTVNELTLVSGFIESIDTTRTVGTSISEGSSGSIWGDIPPYTLSGIEHTTKRTVDFTNRVSGNSWLVGFPDSVTNESWDGVASGSGIIQDVILTPHPTSMRVDDATRFPNHASLTLFTDFNYLNGQIADIDVSGDLVDARHTDTVNVFMHGRYPDKVTNDLGHETTLSDYDLRFGTVEVKGNGNRTTAWERDAFGRIVSFTTADGAVTTNEYLECISCGSAFGIAPIYRVKTTTTRTGTTLAPVKNTYYDVLGRVIRDKTQSFAGTDHSKKEYSFDSQGRVVKTSVPRFTGTSHDIVRIYDIRGRVTNVSRPDGSSTATTYTASGSTVIETITENVKKADGSSDGTHVKRNEYNILGQLVKSTDGYGAGISASTTYSYDANGNMLTAIVDGGTAGTTTTTYEYDQAGNQEKIIGPNIGTVVTTYTALNEVNTVTDSKGQLSTYDYDTLGRLISLVNVDGTNTWNWDTATNGQGKLGSRSHGTDFVETYSYNTEGRLETIDTDIVPISGGSTQSYTTTHTYDSHGRPKTTTFPGSGFVLTRVYNSRGFLSELKDGATAIQTFLDTDAFGISTEESYANGVTTHRTADPKTGRLTDISTSNGGIVFQDNEYAWRSNGTLEYRVANPVNGISTIRKESFAYDVLNRIEKAETFVNAVNTRDLDYSYNELGNILNKTSTLSGDTDVTGYAYGAGSAGPHALTSASIDGVTNTLTYNENGAVKKYNIAGTSDDKYIAYNAYNRPTKVVIGDSWNDTTPVVADKFAYGPDGDRYFRETTWQDGATRTEEIVYIGEVEIITDNIADGIDTIFKTRIGPNIMHVKIEWTTTETFFEYAHRDYLGSIEVVTDDNGTRLNNMAFEPYGSRKNMDWTSNISSSELDTLLDRDWDHSPKVRGFTGHEHLDRTGFVHMNGRMYDPVLGRFISPDPIVQSRQHSQSWNRYSYVLNMPTSGTDPSGLLFVFDLDLGEGVTLAFDCWLFTFECNVLGDRYGINSRGGPLTVSEIIALKTADRHTIASFTRDDVVEFVEFAIELGVDFTPVVGDIKAIVEAFEDPTFVNIAVVPIGMIPGFGDVAARVVKRIPTNAITKKADDMLPALDRTGRTHGKLPKPNELDKFSRDGLEQLHSDLQKSVKNRIAEQIDHAKRGTADIGHARRIAEEQDLIKSIEKRLGN